MGFLISIIRENLSRTHCKNKKAFAGLQMLYLLTDCLLKLFRRNKCNGKRPNFSPLSPLIFTGSNNLSTFNGRCWFIGLPSARRHEGNPTGKPAKPTRPGRRYSQTTVNSYFFYQGLHSKLNA